jgi:hypothetical protein
VVCAEDKRWTPEAVNSLGNEKIFFLSSAILGHFCHHTRQCHMESYNHTIQARFSVFPEFYFDEEMKHLYTSNKNDYKEPLTTRLQ